MNDISQKTEVEISVVDDEDANRVTAVLEALGYTVIRRLDADDDAQSRARWAINRLARRYKLTSREHEILERVVAGRSNTEIGADLELTRATVKWHMTNIFAKTQTETREQLLRLALQLPAGAAEHDGDVALASC